MTRAGQTRNATQAGVARAGQADACPDCKGERGWWGPILCVAPYEHEGVDDCGCPRDWNECRTCHGTGILTGVPRAVYMARGGPAPVQLRGYS